MKRTPFAAISLLALIMASRAAALEIIAPADGSSVADGKVIIIGLAPRAESGKVEFSGQTTSFKVKDGSFSLAVSLPPGPNTLTVTTGSEKIPLKIDVAGPAAKNLYKYHPDVSMEKCKSCHDAGKRLSRNDSVADVCVRCHKTEEKQYAHGPFAMGLCTACHDPHGSANGKDLRLAPLELCNDCHNQPVTEKHRKIAGDDICTDCHNPHSSAKQFMVR